MNTTTPTAQGDEGLAQNLRQMVDDVDQAVKAVTKGGDQKFDAMRDEFAKQVRRIRAQLDDLQDSAIHKARDAARTTDEAVHAHPYEAIGIAAAVGLLIGFLVARR